jgi:hypothetical protein
LKRVLRKIWDFILARLYDQACEKAIQQHDASRKKPSLRVPIEKRYRSRERNALDFYALRETRVYEDKYGFTAPQNIVNEVKKSRQKGVPNAAPSDAPQIQSYY